MGGTLEYALCNLGVSFMSMGNKTLLSNEQPTNHPHATMTINRLVLNVALLDLAQQGSRSRHSANTVLL
jgi:hypothetical protein